MSGVLTLEVKSDGPGGEGNGRAGMSGPGGANHAKKLYLRIPRIIDLCCPELSVFLVKTGPAVKT
jgi:hypothetical protein